MRVLIVEVLVLLLYTGPCLCGRQRECLLRELSEDKVVCVCNGDYCDTLPPLQRPTDGQHYVSYTSSKDGWRFRRGTGKFRDSDYDSGSQGGDTEIRVRPRDKYQTVEGFGGAFTDAAGINVDSLSDRARNNLIRSYFANDGIEYSLGRVPIGGTDFSTHGYSYHDRKADKKLSKFALADEDLDYKIPYIKRALNLTDNNLHLIASAWTAPKWMKTNDEYAGIGFIKPDMYQTWADYFMKFLEEYDREGIEFWALTTGNEPSNGMVPLNKINSVGWPHWQMSNWIKNNLGPTLRKSKFSSLKLFALDDQIFFLPWYIDRLFQDKKTEEYVDGIAIHWYYNKYFPTSVLRTVHDNYPDKLLIQTEACQGTNPFSKHVDIGSWERGEEYANDIIQEMKNYVSGWLDWNMALNLKGGPTYINNNVDSPILVNSTADEFYKQPMFYAIGHFSKFVPRKSVRIYSSDIDNNMPVIAFKRPDRAIVVVILNKNEEDQSVAIVDDSKGTIPLELTGKSITTVIYW